MINTPLFDDYRARVERTLSSYFSLDNETRLSQAMQYSVLSGGKRLRPLLVYAAGVALNASLDVLDSAAAAIECLHCYSLIHDDLPAMDNDVLRRGKPTCHIAFDEATAILAGDALQNLSIELIARERKIPYKFRIKMIKALCKHAGDRGMIGGQMLDLTANKNGDIYLIHRLKTAALFKASVLLGAYAARCEDKNILNALSQFAEALGLAFQLQDDLHDNDDAALIIGVEKTKTQITTLINTAKTALQSLSPETFLLNALCDSIFDERMK